METVNIGRNDYPRHDEKDCAHVRPDCEVATATYKSKYI